jgi:UDP-2,3-diacylglucosamine hydrolase
MRFDIPCLGPKTLETCAAARIAVLAIEAGKSLLLEQELCDALAKRHAVTVTTIA